MYEHVLVPTDHSEGAERAVERALEIAQATDATLHVLYVLDENVYGDVPALGTDELYLDDLEREAASKLEDVAERAADRGVTAEAHTRHGTPHEEIVDYAAESGVDAIVMGRHGVGDHGSHHLGSVTDRVVRNTDLPVVVV
jgi:nucleotide-binding universal stress UspA family protein